METNPDPIEEVLELCEQLLEGKLTSEGMARLEKLVRADATARRAYVEYLHQHASLNWSVGTQGELSIAALEKAAKEQAESKQVPVSVAFPQWKRWLALAACVGLVAALVWFREAKPVAPVGNKVASAAFATLAETRNCKWAASALPTEEGSRMAAGRLRLAEGVATIAFDNGARVILEAPADLELVSAKRCVLHQGMLVARISHQAIGFTVETATAKLIDFGTEFGVSASAGGETQVQVIEGIVDVQQIKSGQTQRLTAGKTSRVSATQLTVQDEKSSEPQRVNTHSPADEIAPGTITLTTAFGRGKDAFVQSEPSDRHTSDVLLLVKNSMGPHYCRKAYLGFDLSTLPVGQIREAKLVLSMTSSGYGYASLTPKTVFRVYGLTDQALDNWQESSIKWDNAPANLAGGGDLDEKKVTLVGTFEVPAVVTEGEFSISGSALVDFLNQDINGLATFIVVRETKETKPFSLVHGFVSKRHSSGTPPTLRITLN